MGFSVTAQVPGSAANLGPGFDVLGLALQLYDRWTLREVTGGPAVSVETGGAPVPQDKRNLAYQAARNLFRLAGKKLPAVKLVLESSLPVAGGLGSSSAAIVGGLVTANRALGNKFSREALLGLAAQLEGHPDNVAPALYGGFCAAVMTGSRVAHISVGNSRIFRNLRAVVVTPDFALPTARARQALPKKITHADGVFNAGRVALMTLALAGGRWDLLAEAMEDRLHEPYRRKLVPGFGAVIKAAKRSGAFGACLSGAGPTILAFASVRRAPAVERAMVRAFARAGKRAAARNVGIDTEGARILQYTRT